MLVYSVTECASPVWINSSHYSKIDDQLNHYKHIISGTIKVTPTEWIPVLYNILPPHIRRKKSACREWSTYLSNTSLPLHQDTSNQNLRLNSRKPAYLTKILCGTLSAPLTAQWENATEATDNVVKWIRTLDI